MERRVALATAGAVTSTLVAGTISFAAITGTSILGFGGQSRQAAASAPQVVTRVQTITDQVVVPSATTVPGDAGAPVDPAAAPADQPGTNSPRGSGRYTVATTAPAGASGAVLPSDTTLPATPTTVPTTKWPTTPIGEPATTAAPSPSPSATTAPSATPATTSAPTTATTIATTAAPTTTKAPTTTAAATTTTAPAATTTTRPPGVPADWPASKPIPPMPPGCKQGQLEDNGVWNCQN